MIFLLFDMVLKTLLRVLWLGVGSVVWGPAGGRAKGDVAKVLVIISFLEAQPKAMLQKSQ